MTYTKRQSLQRKNIAKTADFIFYYGLHLLHDKLT